jgi:replicative DNA helicase
MMLSQEAVAKARITLAPEDFYKLANQDVYRHLLDHMDQFDKFDIVLFDKHLRDAGKMEKIGGRAYLIDLCEAVPSSANAEHYIEVVREAAAMRRMLSVVRKSAAKAKVPGMKPETIAQDLWDALEAETERAKPPVADITEALHGVLEDMAAAAEGNMPGIPMGVDALDRHGHLLIPGTMTLLGGFTKAGKTSFAANVTGTNVLVYERTVLFFSAEMPTKELLKLLTAWRSRVDFHKIRTGTADAEEMDRVEEAAVAINDARDRLLIDDTPSIRVQDMFNRAKALTTQRPVDLIVVDHAQDVRASGEDKNREVTAAGDTCRRMARLTGTPVMLLTQLSKRKDGSIGPMWSRELAQKCDNFLMLRARAEVESEDEKEDDICPRFFTCKLNRYGPPYRETVMFDKPKRRFYEA